MHVSEKQCRRQVVTSKTSRYSPVPSISGCDKASATLLKKYLSNICIYMERI